MFPEWKMGFIWDVRSRFDAVFWRPRILAHPFKEHRRIKTGFSASRTILIFSSDE